MAQFPAGLRRGGEHEWVRSGEGGATARIGITAAAAADLGDVVRVELPTVGSEVVAGDACGEPESTSTALEVHSPLTGVVSAVNEAAAAALSDADPMVVEGVVMKRSITEWNPVTGVFAQA